MSPPLPIEADTGMFPAADPVPETKPALTRFVLRLPAGLGAASGRGSHRIFVGSLSEMRNNRDSRIPIHTAQSCPLRFSIPPSVAACSSWLLLGSLIRGRGPKPGLEAPNGSNNKSFYILQFKEPPPHVLSII